MKDVYTIADLADRATLDAGTDQPAKLCVIGDPVKHSKSPQMHQASLDAQKCGLRYIRVHVQAGAVKEALQRLEDLGFIGVNVTVPHKLEVMDACDELTETAKQLGAVNTVHFTKHGWLGHNTDGPGLASALSEELGKTFSDSPTLIIGAGGGAGRAIAIQAALDKCPRLILANRTVSKLESIASTIREIHPDCELSLISSAHSELSQHHPDLIINTTSLGMKENDPLPYPPSSMNPSQVFYDAVYTPPLTAMLKAAKDIGCRVANGQSMLVHQGALSYSMWLRQDADIAKMHEAIL